MSMKEIEAFTGLVCKAAITAALIIGSILVLFISVDLDMKGQSLEAAPSCFVAIGMMAAAYGLLNCIISVIKKSRKKRR